MYFGNFKDRSKTKKKVVIGTTGFTKKEENLIKKFSQKIPILKAGNMSLGVNLLIYLTEIASKSLGNNFLSKVYEVHHKHKVDYPSGTALMLGRGISDGKNKNFHSLMGKKYLNKKTFPYSNKINFNSIRKSEVIGEHEVRFSSGKEIIKLNHESFDRSLYSEGALTAASWLMTKKSGLIIFSIINSYLSNYIRNIRTGDPNENNENYWMMSYDFKSNKKTDFVPEDVKLRKRKRSRNNLIFVLYINTFLIFIIFNSFLAHFLEIILN